MSIWNEIRYLLRTEFELGPEMGIRYVKEMPGPAFYVSQHVKFERTLTDYGMTWPPKKPRTFRGTALAGVLVFGEEALNTAARNNPEIGRLLVEYKLTGQDKNDDPE